MCGREKPRPGDVSLPEGTVERVREWAEGEEAKERGEEELVEELSQAMRARGHDPTPIRQVRVLEGSFRGIRRTSWCGML